MLRVLHTADWHLGRPFHGESLLPAQAAAIDAMVAAAREAQVGAVLISGDLYDRALPPVDAVRLADEALCRLSEVCPVVVISGNHDSAPRLGFGASLLDRAGVHVRTELACVGQAVALDGLDVFAIPYLEPDLVRDELGMVERGHGPALEAAMERVRAGLRPGVPSGVMAHAFVAGGQETASERDLSVGGAASVSAAVFRGADYVALGHLHTPQTVGHAAAYSGSPVAFSFSEAGHQKSFRIVDVGTRAAEVVPIPAWRPLAVLRGKLEELLGDPAHAAAERAWVSVVLTDAVRPEDAMERLRRRFEHAVLLAFEPEGAPASAAASYAARHRGLSDAELVAGFVEDVRGTPASAAEAALFEEAMTAGRLREASR